MGLISTIQNKTEQARAKERIKPLLESRMMRDILLEVGQRGTEKLDPQSVPLEQRPRAAKLAAENGTAGLQMCIRDRGVVVPDAHRLACVGAGQQGLQVFLAGLPVRLHVGIRSGCVAVRGEADVYKRQRLIFTVWR